MIGDDILQIGTSKWSQQCEDITATIENVDSCFMLPSVANVSIELCYIENLYITIYS